MTIPAEISAIETRLKENKVSIQDVCDAAGVNRATYQRWKSGDTMPLWKTWDRFNIAVEKATNSGGDHAV